MVLGGEAKGLPHPLRIQRIVMQRGKEAKPHDPFLFGGPLDLLFKLRKIRIHHGKKREPVGQGRVSLQIALQPRHGVVIKQRTEARGNGSLQSGVLAEAL